MYQKSEALLELQRPKDALDVINSALALEPTHEGLNKLLIRLNTVMKEPQPISRNGKTVVSVSNVGSLAPSSSHARVYKDNETTIASFITKNDLTSKPKGAIRIVCFSDTHTKQDNLPVPPGDILIHGMQSFCIINLMIEAGDFSYTGAVNEVVKFSDWLSKQPHKHKIVVSGNSILQSLSNLKEITKLHLKKTFMIVLGRDSTLVVKKTQSPPNLHSQIASISKIKL